MKKLLTLLFLISSLSLASVEIQQFDGAKQESDYRELIQELRCPQCQNNNIADSNATIATDMRHKTLELLKQGKSKDEVIHYMVERYGHFVTYDPPITLATSLLWIMPLLLLSVGVITILKRRKSIPFNSEKKNLETFDHVRLNQILDEKDKL